MRIGIRKRVVNQTIRLSLSNKIPINEIDSIISREFHISQDELWYDDIETEMILSCYKNIDKDYLYKLECSRNKGLEFIKYINKGVNKLIVSDEQTEETFYG